MLALLFNQPQGDPPFVIAKGSGSVELVSAGSGEAALPYQAQTSATLPTEGRGTVKP